MERIDLGALSAFLIVAEERSFTRAAKRLGVSPSAISHAMRELEEAIGVRLLSRTTRSVSLTDAGAHLRARLHPAFTEIQDALGQVSGLRNQPAGRVRLLVPRLAANTVLGPKIGEFVLNFPDIVLDITTDDTRMDIVSRGFDAGIQFGEYIEKDMIAVRVSPDLKPVMVGSPGVFCIAPKAEVAARSRPPPVYQLSARRRRHIPLGVRQGQEIPFRCSQRAVDRRRPGPGYPCRNRRCRARIYGRR